MKGSGLSQVRARRVVAELEDERPWYTKEEYLEALCSLITLFPSEVSKPTAQAGKTVKEVIIASCSGERLMFLWNNLIYRRAYPEHMLQILSSGSGK